MARLYSNENFPQLGVAALRQLGLDGLQGQLLRINRAN